MNHCVPIAFKAACNRSLEIVRSEGFRSLWTRFLGVAFYRRMDIFERKTNPASRDPELPGGLEIRLLAAGEVDEFVKFRALHDPETILGRLQQGQVCFLVRHHGVIIHNAWITTKLARINYLACDFQLARGVVYVFEAYTCAPWRGKSISSMRKAVMEKYCHEQGYQRLLAVVWPENRPAYRNVKKAGYERVGRTGYIGIGRFRKHFCRYQGDDPPFRMTPQMDNKTSKYRAPVFKPEPYDNDH